MSSTERTPLRSSEQGSNYVFNTTPHRTYRNRIRKFQCCVCAAVLSIFVIALVITVSWTVNHDPDVEPTTPSPGNLTASEMQRLLELSWPLPADISTSHWPSEPSGAEVEEAIEAGKAGLRDRDVLEESNIPLDINTPSYRHQKAVGTGEEATKLARIGYIMDLATQKVVKGMRDRNGTWSPQGRGPTLHADWLPDEVCGDGPRFVDMCSKTPYRSADGVCNNPNHPRRWGVAMRPFRRMLPPDYADGVSAPRVATDGTSLPSARKVSKLVHRPMYRDDPDFTVMLAVWGQFMDHDITATALSKGVNMSAISCCNAVNTPEKLHPECYTVRLRDGDEYYNQYNVSCMEFVRSAPAPTCSLGPREQLNQATSFLDGSVVYGSSDQLMRELRTLEGGQLKMTFTADGRSLLPYNEDPKDGCNQEEEAKQGRYCFASGDSRANENIHLTTMHLLLARQHNLAAKQLASLNPTWNDERIFQESRKIVAAQIQHITYNEFLPVLLGRNLMESMEIYPQSSGYYKGYNASVDPTIANEFAAAAFRFAHTLLPGLIRMIGNNNTSQDYIELHKMLFNPFDLYKSGQMDNTIRGAIATNTERVDPFFTSEVTEKLFQGSRPVNGGRFPCGLDLVTLNIQRGRDHGLPGYPAWRKHCGLSVPQSFKDLRGMIDNDTIHRITSMYRSVEDIDMYTGALSEFPVEGGVLGPTVVCLLADQFFRLKIGDRFWYETVHEPQAFTPEQLQEIRKTTLAGIICANSDNIMSAQPWVMRTKRPGNIAVPCYGNTIEHPDLSVWEEKDGAFVRPGIGRVRLGPLNSIIAIKKKQLSPITESSNNAVYNSKEDILKWKEAIKKWTDQDDFWKSTGPKWNDTFLKNGTAEGQSMDAEDIADADEEMGLWTDDNGFISFHSKSNLSQLLKTSDSQTSAPNAIVGRVLSGSITAMTNGISPVTWWGGELPLTISRRPFNSVANYTDAKDILEDMPLLGKGVQWKATMQNNSGIVQLTGSFSMPKYIPFPNFTSQWWIGSFTFDVILCGSFNESLFLPNNSFLSPLYFQKKSDLSPSVLQYKTKTMVPPDIRKQFKVPRQENINSAMKAPVILLGAFMGQSGFSWSGEFIFVLPNCSVNTVDANYTFKNEALANNGLMKSLHQAAITDPSIETNKLDKVMKLQDDISKWEDQIEEWKDQDVGWQKISSEWKDIFSNESTSTTVVPPLDAHIIVDADEEMGLWANDSAFVPVRSTASLPQYLRTSYRNQNQMDKPKTIFGRLLSGSITAMTDGIFPVVWWKGDLPLVITRRPFDSVANYTDVKDVLGDVPVFGQGVYWKATIQNNSGTIQLKGSFSVQKYIREPTLSIQWWTGDFTFDVIFDGGFSETFLPSNTLFSSPLYFHQKNDRSPFLLQYQNKTKFESIFEIKYEVPSQANVNSASKAPLILLGSFLGKSAFMWSGEFILVLPTPLVNSTENGPPYTRPSYNNVTKHDTSQLKQQVVDTKLDKPYKGGNWEDKVSEWKDQIEKWKDQDADWKNINSKWKDIFSNGSSSRTHPFPIDGIADGNTGLWADDNGYIPVHSISNMPRLLEASTSNQDQWSAPKTIFGRLLSGSVTAMADGIFPVCWWSNELPLALERRPFDPVANRTGGKNVLGDMPVFGQGVHWKATIENVSGKSRLNGTFSVQRYFHEPIFSVQWWTGVFSFEVIFESTINEPLLLAQTLYSSPLYMHEKTDHTPDLLVYANKTPFQPDFGIKFQVPSQKMIDSAPLAPLILLGAHLGESSFLWSGEFILVLPQPVRSSQKAPNETQKSTTTRDNE